MAIDPLSQFEIYTVVQLGAEDGPDLSFTTIALWTVAAVALIIGFFAIATRRPTIVPNRVQSVAELGYEFVASMIRDVIGPDGMRFFPFVFSLFIFILTCNMIGMLVITPTVTSQLAVTVTLALTAIAVVIGFGLYKHRLGFFKLFAPSGLPFVMYFLIVPIEIISFLSRPLTLAVRLFVNMLAGHILLKLFAAFVGALLAAEGLGVFGWVAALIPMFATFFVVALEFLVAALQAYVFAILTVIYLNDVVHMHH